MSCNHPTLLLVDDDKIWCDTIGHALERRGFVVTIAHDVDSAARVLRDTPPCHALIDLRLGARSGLELVALATRIAPAIRIVILTGYASISTAVEAIKLGATQYLAKPARIGEIIDAFGHNPAGNAKAPIAEQPPSVHRLEWEHIQRVLKAHNGNISATARALNMHRRTLQRKLQKHPVRR